jgi:aspartyl-tRNA(Asn)/glutamyl-tRNA(Gln) amidotransferase subunit A
MIRRCVTRRSFLAGLCADSGMAILGAAACSLRRGPGNALSSDPGQLDLLDAAREVQGRALSPIELTRACLERIERFNPRLNAYITVTPEPALAEARQAEHEIVNGRWRGPLHGIPVAIKDNIDTAGLRTTAGSAVFANRVPTKDAEVVHRLKAAGAIVLGKLNLHELGIGATSVISHYGPVHNPWDLDRIAGGSSGGSAAAVAAALCFAAVGTDTGGSIRSPASCCGIVGLKPSYGVVSLRGTIPMSPSFDHVGPMARTVVDTALMFRAMTDHPVAEQYDPDAPPPVSSLRVGVLSTSGPLCDFPAEPEIQAAFDAAIDVIRTLVAEVHDAIVPMPDLGGVIDAEAYAYHAAHLAATPELYDPRTRAALLGGRDISEVEAERLREELTRHRASIREAFTRVDLVVVPTTPGLPIPIRGADDPYAASGCNFAFNTGGLPSLSLPCGFSLSGLPIGLQISGPPLSEPYIFALAQAYELVTAWHKRRPSLLAGSGRYEGAPQEATPADRPLWQEGWRTE